MNVSQHDKDSVKVWDPLVRIFHWSLVVNFFLAFITEDEWLRVHVVAGYTVAALIAFRLLWGLIGTRYARFTQFVTSPARVLEYLSQMLKLNVPHYLGHNPAAAAMIVSLLLSIILVSLSGVAILAAEGKGPLADTFLAAFNAHWMEEIHEFFANFTMLLVMLHVAGVVVSSLLEGDNLVKAMITGHKKNRSEFVDR